MCLCLGWGSDCAGVKCRVEEVKWFFHVSVRRVLFEELDAPLGHKEKGKGSDGGGEEERWEVDFHVAFRRVLFEEFNTLSGHKEAGQRKGKDERIGRRAGEGRGKSTTPKC